MQGWYISRAFQPNYVAVIMKDLTTVVIGNTREKRPAPGDTRGCGAGCHQHVENTLGNTRLSACEKT